MNTDLPRFGKRFPTVFEDFHREMEEMLKRFFDCDASSERGHQSLPRANVAEMRNDYEVTLDLRGLKPEDVSIKIRDGELWITGERHEDRKGRQQIQHRVERSYGQLSRAIRLGQNGGADRVTAKYNDGVLSVTVPRTETAGPMRITVKV
jgi:HSP20 family protein